MPKQTPPKQAVDAGPVRKSAGQKPKGNPKPAGGGKIFGAWQHRRVKGPKVPV